MQARTKMSPEERSARSREWMKKYLASEKGKATRKVYYERNKHKYLPRHKKWREKNRETWLACQRKADLKRYYGITPEQWNDLFERQGRKCDSCGSPSPGNKLGHWATDHRHDPHLLRGILCRGCNAAIGQAKESPQRLRLIADYLERTNACN